jgi:hypothetical protein
VAHIPIIEYDTYDAYIGIMNKDDIVTSNILNVHFKMAFINEEFTRMHMAIKYCFLGVSFILCIKYLCLICKLPRTVPITYD